MLYAPGDTVFLRIDLSSLPAGVTSASISKATLKVYVGSVLAVGSFNVNRVPSAWNERAVTSANAPPIGSTILSGVTVYVQYVMQ